MRANKSPCVETRLVENGRSQYWLCPVCGVTNIAQARNIDDIDQDPIHKTISTCACCGKRFILKITSEED